MLAGKILTDGEGKTQETILNTIKVECEKISVDFNHSFDLFPQEDSSQNL